jgi:hypothetical protein
MVRTRKRRRLRRNKKVQNPDFVQTVPEFLKEQIEKGRT